MKLLYFINSFPSFISVSFSSGVVNEKINEPRYLSKLKFDEEKIKKKNLFKKTVFSRKYFKVNYPRPNRDFKCLSIYLKWNLNKNQEKNFEWKSKIYDIKRFLDPKVTATGKKYLFIPCFILFLVFFSPFFLMLFMNNASA